MSASREPRLHRRILAEPLFHFAVLGGLLFAVHALVAPEDDDAPAAVAAEPRDDAPDRTLDLAAARADLAREISGRSGREPTPEELDRHLRGWIDEEILYREGLARQLDRDDAVVRARVVKKMTYLLERQGGEARPTDAEVRAHFEAHRERYARPTRLDFTQVFVDGNAGDSAERARRLLDQLRGGADPAGLGDRFTGGRRFRGRKLPDLAEAFGDEFVRGLAEQPPGEWHARESRFGVHLVRIDERVDGGPPDLDAARGAIESDLRDAQRQQAFADAFAQLKASWRLVDR